MTSEASEAQQVQEIGRAFVEFLVELHLVRKADLDECVKKAADSSSDVASLLVRDGYLTEYQVGKLLRRIEFEPIVCHFCTKKIVLEKGKVDLATMGTKCPGCEKQISFFTETASYGEALVIDHPRIFGDRIMMSILVKDGVFDAATGRKHLALAHKTYPKTPLGAYLLAKDLIEEEDLIKVQRRRDNALRNKYPFLDGLEEDVELGRFLISVGLVSLNKLNKCLLAQSKEASKGEYTSLRKLLLDAGELTQHQVSVFLSRQFDRHSKRTAILARQRPIDDPVLQPELEEEEDAAMKSERLEIEGLMTIELEGDTDLRAEKEKQREDNKKENFAPGNMLKAYIKKTYGD